MSMVRKARALEVFKKEKISKNTLFQILEEIPAAVLFYREKILYANQFACKISGYSLEELKEKYSWEFSPEGKREEVKERVLKRIRGEFLEDSEGITSFFSKQGKKIYMKYRAKTISVEGEYYGIFFGIDVTKEVEYGKRIEGWIKRLEEFLRYSSDILSIIDENGRIVYKSPSVEEILGWSQKELIGKSVFEQIHPDDRVRFGIAHKKVFEDPGRRLLIEYRVKDKERRWRYMEGSIYLPENWKDLGIEGAILNERDISKKKEVESSLQKIVHYDPLTGLPRQSRFLEGLSSEIVRASLIKRYVSVIFLNLRNFKDINLIYGISVGDYILKEIANKLKELKIFVSRFFGDAFGLFFSAEGISEISEIAEKIREIFESPFKIGGREIRISFYLGISVYPTDGSSAEELLKKAELASLKAKELGENRISFYSEEIERDVLEKGIIRSSLIKALEKGEFVIYYQPIISLRNEKTVGFEALIRWIHPELGFLYPDRFIPVAEETGFILKLSEYVTERAIRETKKIQEEVGRNFFIGINFSAKQFLHEDLLGVIDRIIKKYGFEYSDLVLEITERTAMQQPERTKKILSELRKRGIKVAIDDFGTAYSSMEYLIEFDVDKIKIDKKFVLSMLENEKAMSIVKMVVNLSESINVNSLAEGVETEEHFLILKEIGCTEAQGYYFSPPVPFEKIKEFLKRVG